MTNLSLTPIIFGPQAIRKLNQNLPQQYQKALLVTGKGSIKRNGLYDDLKKELAKAQIELIEFFGIKPNPTNEQIDEAAQKGKDHKVDLVIAAGGGSAIDAAKVIATMISNPMIKKSWSLVTKEVTFKNQPIDVISIITLAGTASENNAGSVVTNEIIPAKKSVATRKPVLCIADPTYTQTVSAWQTASGIFDAFSHTLEQINATKDIFNWTDNYNIATLKTLITNAPLVLKNPNNYEARANILFAASMALNGLASFAMPNGDWTVHAIAHGIAAVYDTTHGATLALITPSYSRYRANKDSEFKKRLLFVGKNLFQTDTVETTLVKLEAFIKLLKLPTRWSDFKNCQTISEDDLIKIPSLVRSGTQINKTEILAVLKMIPK